MGALGSLLAVYVLWIKDRLPEFMPREFGNISIVAFFRPFNANGPGDQYQHALWIRLRNSGAHALYIVRAVYFKDKKERVPVYVNASTSQKYPRGYETKFGRGFFEHHVLVEPGEETETYIPLSREIMDEEVPARQRGYLVLEYVYDGKTGKHRAIL